MIFINKYSNYKIYCALYKIELYSDLNKILLKSKENSKKS